MAVDSATHVERRNLQREKNEEYSKQLALKEKRHRREIAGLQKKHTEEVRNIQKANQEKIRGIVKESNQSLTERDRYFQNEIKRVNEAHRKKLKNQSEDYETKMKTVLDTSRGEVKKTKQIARQQAEAREQNYANQIDKKNNEFSDYAELQSQKQDEAIKNIRKRILEKKQDEFEVIDEAHTDRVDGLERRLRFEKEARANENTLWKEKFTNEKRRLNENLRDTVSRERAFFDEVLTAQQEAKSNGLNRIKDKYGRALKDYKENNEKANEDYREYVQDRVQGRLDKMNTYVEEVKRKNQAEKIRERTFNKIAQDNLRAQMRESNENLQLRSEMQREDIMNDHTKTMKKVHAEMTDHFDDTVKFYQSNVARLKENHKKHLEEEKVLNEFKTSQTIKQADKRVKNIKQASLREEETIKNYYKDRLDGIKQDEEIEKKQIRDSMEKESKNAVSSLQKRIAEVVEKKDSEIEMLKNENQKKLNELQDKLLREKRGADRRMSHQVDALKRQFNAQVEEQSIANKAKINELQKEHRQTIKTMQARHQRELEEIANRTKKS